ncbi:MAG: hypothetical protein ACRD51_15535, partial [Candidatus Acidiferrum sp.]
PKAKGEFMLLLGFVGISAHSRIPWRTCVTSNLRAEMRGKMTVDVNGRAIVPLVFQIASIGILSWRFS